MLYFLWPVAILFTMTSVFAQTGGVEAWRGWIKEARSAHTSLADREVVAQRVLKSMRGDLAREFGVEDPEKFYQTIVAQPEKLQELTKRGGKYDQLFTDFSMLVSQIAVEKQLQHCDDYQTMKAGLLDGTSSYSPCAEGGSLQTYIVWESKKKGEIEGKEYSIPNFMYSENVTDLLDITNRYHSDYGSESEPPLLPRIQEISEVHPEMKPDELQRAYGMMKLQNDAYQRTIMNAARNALTLEIQYNSSGWSPSELAKNVTATIETMCQHCSATTKKSMAARLNTVMKNDIHESRVYPRNPEFIAQDLCAKLQDQKYPFSEHLTTREQVSLISNVAGMAKAKKERAARERLGILSKLAQAGGDGLLILTESLTDLDEKAPARTKLKCNEWDLKADAELVRQAGKEAKAKAMAYAQKINDDLKSGPSLASAKNNLKMLFRTNPRSVGEALSENSKMGSFACSVIDELKSYDEAKEFTDDLIIWGSAVVGGALTLTGILAPAGAAITMGALALGTAVGVGTGVYEYSNAQDALERSELYESAMFATRDTRTLEITQKEFEYYQSKKLSAMMNFGFSAVDVLATVKTLVKSGRTIAEASDLVADGVVDASNVSKMTDDVAEEVVLKAEAQSLKVGKYVESISHDPKWAPLAERIKAARAREAGKLGPKRTNLLNEAVETGAERRFPDYGYSRVKEFEAFTDSKSLDDVLEKFNFGDGYEMYDEQMKIIISPKNKIPGQEYVEIRYDISGNYFRLQKGKCGNGTRLKFTDKENMFVDWDGNLINTKGMSPDSPEFIKLMEKSHWLNQSK